MFEPNTTFLLCSDGVTRHIPDVEIRELLALSHPPVLICSQMKDICYERGAEDNLTAVIIRLSGSETAQISDTEESTVASARQSMDETLHDYNEIPTQNLQIPAEVLQPQTLQEIPPPTMPAQMVNENSMTISGNKMTEKSDTIRIERDEKTFTLDEKNGSGIFGKILLFLLGMIFGAALAGLGYYLWASSQTPEPVPQIKEMQSPNIAFTSFETARRNVDSDPQKYITAQGSTATNSEDFYLLGRAYMLTGKYPEAKDAFTKAKERLGDFKGDVKDKVMLGNEIALGFSAINNGFAQKVLEAEKVTKTNAQTPSNTANTNAGSATSNADANK